METQFKGTKGPWLMNTTDKFINNENGLALTTENNVLVCSVSHDLTVLTSEEYSANAQLIASAPLLLENLVRLVERMEENDLGNMNAVRRAKEAISQAVGQGVDIASTK